MIQIEIWKDSGNGPGKISGKESCKNDSGWDSGKILVRSLDGFWKEPGRIVQRFCGDS